MAAAAVSARVLKQPRSHRSHDITSKTLKSIPIRIVRSRGPTKLHSIKVSAASGSKTDKVVGIDLGTLILVSSLHAPFIKQSNGVRR